MPLINGKNLCLNCFSELGDTSVCSKCGYDNNQIEPDSGSLEKGTVLLGQYIIGRVLGRGGFGITYLAYDMKNNQIVAIKEYMPDTLAYRMPGNTKVFTYSGEDKEQSFKMGSEKFYEEAKTVARFNGHPNIIHVYQFFYENNTAYFVMEYMQGIDLKHYVENAGGKISWQEAFQLLTPIIDALLLIHSIGVLHRDISPDNIYITSDGTAKLLDFGSARQVLSEKSKSLSVILKPGFAPIEQYQTHGKQGAWTDIYSLAATIYYCITGKVPVASMDRVETDSLLPPSKINGDIPTKVDRILLKALNIRAVYRYQTSNEFKTDLQKILLEKNDSLKTLFIPKTKVTKPKEINQQEKVEQKRISETEEAFLINATQVKVKNKEKRNEITLFNLLKKIKLMEMFKNKKTIIALASSAFVIVLSVALILFINYGFVSDSIKSNTPQNDDIIMNSSEVSLLPTSSNDTSGITSESSNISSSLSSNISSIISQSSGVLISSKPSVSSSIKSSSTVQISSKISSNINPSSSSPPPSSSKTSSIYIPPSSSKASSQTSTSKPPSSSSSKPPSSSSQPPLSSSSSIPEPSSAPPYNGKMYVSANVPATAKPGTSCSVSISFENCINPNVTILISSAGGSVSGSYSINFGSGTQRINMSGTSDISISFTTGSDGTTSSVTVYANDSDYTLGTESYSVKSVN